PHTQSPSNSAADSRRSHRRDTIERLERADHGKAAASRGYRNAAEQFAFFHASRRSRSSALAHDIRRVRAGSFRNGAAPSIKRGRALLLEAILFGRGGSVLAGRSAEPFESLCDRPRRKIEIHE